MRKLVLWATLAGIFLVSLVYINEAQAQVNESVKDQLPNPKVAFLKSLVVPGWGHYYVDKHHWERGKFHLAGEAILILSYVGLRVRSNHIEHDMYAYTRAYAGIDIQSKDRAFRLAVGNFNDTQTYNDYQERARNWDQLYPDQPRYQWNWENTADRKRYLDMRDRLDRIDRQLPAIISLMVINRVVSGVSAYLRAKKAMENVPEIGFAMPRAGSKGIMAQVRFQF